MEIGLLTDSLGDLPLEHALDIAAEQGVTTIELAFGGWSSTPHTDLEELLASAASRSRLLAAIESRGLRLEALNASGNQLHPVHGPAHDEILRGVLDLAQELGVDTVVAMSGLPAAPGDSFPAWITTVWPPENLTLLDHQWDVAVRHWERTALLAATRGVERIAVEMHANQLVYSVPGLLRLREAVGPVLGANFDPSHLWWMGADPLRAIEALKGAIHHVHAKDTAVHDERVAVRSRLETLPNTDVEHRAWNYVAVGAGEPSGDAFWTRFIDALSRAGYDGPLSIENEDYSLSSTESVSLAAGTLRRALAAASPR